MIWIFLSVVLVLAVYHRGFRSGCLVILVAMLFGIAALVWSIENESAKNTGHASAGSSWDVSRWTSSPTPPDSRKNARPARSSGSDRLAHSGHGEATASAEPGVPEPTVSDTESSADTPSADATERPLSAMTDSERQSVESVCSNDKILNGPAAYRACRAHQLAAWQKGPRHPDLSGLDRVDRDSIDSVCASDKLLKGPAAYNRCLTAQWASLGPNDHAPSLAGLSQGERESIESVCTSDKILNGPAAYHRCLKHHLQELARLP